MLGLRYLRFFTAANAAPNCCMPNAMFFTLADKEWTVPVPHCPQCNPNEETTKGIPVAGTQ
ncbi:MAG TPA: hypothetical protein VN833_18155 [Candidatus Acidoferrales bacterium]|jgi:hypothetical protein|nr:hypothetical protein [Candidatus Acidoferrales bacterium]